ncbi:MAG: hypothetical protein ACREHE_12010 [Rhizomicrobium sp.]
MKPAYLLHFVLACHTLITAATVGLICCLDYGGVAGLTLGPRPLLWLALVWPPLIGLQLILNRGDCLFQTWARDLHGGSRGRVRDLYLVPESWAPHIPLLFTPLHLAGAALVAWHALFRS